VEIQLFGSSATLVKDELIEPRLFSIAQT
jgi:hypothetical protein